MGRRLALVAGSGAIVPHLIAAVRRSGNPLKVLSLSGEGFATAETTVRLDEPQALLERARAFEATHMVFAGGVRLSDADRKVWARFGGAGELTVGDTALAEILSAVRIAWGIDFLGAHEIAPELVAAAGHLAGPDPDQAMQEQAAYALARCRESGRLDLGQALVFSGYRAIASEDIDGTDALLLRVRGYVERGLTGDGAARLVLAKASKPDQPVFVDLPAIGPKTIEHASNAGVAVVAVEAGRTLLIEREMLFAQANERGVTVLSLDADHE